MNMVLGIILMIIAVILLIMAVISFSARKKVKSPTGFYVIDGVSLKSLNELPGNGSINAIAESLGHSPKKTHTYFPQNTDIKFISFDKDSKKPLFVEATNKEKPLTYSSIAAEINKINWNLEYL